MEKNNIDNGQGVESASSQLVETQTATELSPEHRSMETLLEEQGLELDFPKQGEIRTGTIASIGENEVLVSVGTKSEGVISGREFEQIPDEEKDSFQVGAEITVYVVTPEDSNGNVVLSYTRAREENDWEQAEKLLKDSDTLESKIIGYNKGGLLVPLGRLRGFVPASQVSLSRRANMSGDTPEQRWGKMVGDALMVRVIEVDRERRRLILSERAAMQETRDTLKERLLDELNEGDMRTGRVTSLADFGAFVNIDGADGLVHLSEISWERVQHPSEVLNIGQEVDVKVISIDRERKRIGLSIRQLQADPWLKKIDHLKEGQLIEGKITHLTKFGAFARLGEDLEGLIHISEMSEQRINHPKEVVKEGDELTLRVLKIDPERRRIGLSLRKVDSVAYSDIDWKMLEGEVEEAQEDAANEEDTAGESVADLVPEAVVEKVEAMAAEEVSGQEPVQESPGVAEPTSEIEEITEDGEEAEPEEEVLVEMKAEAEAEAIAADKSDMVAEALPEAEVEAESQEE